MAGPIVGLGDGADGEAHGGNAGAIAGADGQVAGDGEGFGRQGRETHRVAPVSEESPLGGVNAPGVVGEDGFQGVGHAPVGGAQGPAGPQAPGGRSGCWWRWSWGSPEG